MKNLRKKINVHERKDKEKIALIFALLLTIIIAVVWFITLKYRLTHSNGIFIQEKENFQMFIQKIKRQISTAKEEEIFRIDTCNRSTIEEGKNLKKNS